MKVISIRKEKILIVFYLLILLVGVVRSYRNETVSVSAMPVAKKVVLIDAGHGGWDPGKVSESDNVLEKDINLQVALKLQAYLEQGGSVVLMTRIEDEALSNSKSLDMKSRKDLANVSKADILISVHQNSYPQENVQGAQVFYFNESEKSKRLAECIQTEIKNFADPDNRRLAKANTDYYVLKQTVVPAVIVECGFLSSNAERRELTTDEYQEKIAWSIYKGVIRYFGDDESPEMAIEK